MFDLSKRQNRKNGRKEYLASVQDTADLIREAVRGCTFAEGMLINTTLLNFDLQYLTRNERDVENITAILEDLTSGEHVSRILSESPELYRDVIAPGFVRRDRLTAGGLPRDGAHKSLASYTKHMHFRHSMLLPVEETDMVEGLLGLTGTMLQTYIRMQRDALTEED